MQKALIVRDDSISTSTLDRMLEGGWRVVNTCGMPSCVAKGSGFEIADKPPTCLVILEKS